MLEPFLLLGALALELLSAPRHLRSLDAVVAAAASGDPGPHPDCPKDMRLVRGAHSDEMLHVCTDARPSAKDTHCFAYEEDISALEGPSTEIDVCMDQFEAPNQRGAKPYAMKSFEMAEKWCGERGKRTCTEQEWEYACEGPEHRPWAYGWTNVLDRCNSGKPWRAFDPKKLASKEGDESKEELARLWQGEPSGKNEGCASSFGVFDMMGNVEEWVASRKRRRFRGALMGGFWSKPWTGCRGTNDAHEERFVFYETGFRCCARPGTLDERGRRKKKTN